MKKPIFRRTQQPVQGHEEQGVTMVLVAVCMVALIAMAALSIDVVTLYLAREEAQRAADAGALAAARVISVSGITGTVDPDNNGDGSWTKICGGSTSLASVTARAAAQENAVTGSAAGHVTVTYSAGTGTGNQDCTPLSAQFGVNPLVTVLVRRNSMPTLFSRIWSRNTNTVSARATAEAFNPSNVVADGLSAAPVPVTPRCVKPWIIPNEDPAKPGSGFVDKTTGQIQTIGIQLGGVGTGIIGESFQLRTNCKQPGTDCTPPGDVVSNPPAAGFYIPAHVTSPAIAFLAACAPDGTDYETAIGGCDLSTVYACGTLNGSTADLSINPGGSNRDTSKATQCLIHKGNGQDIVDYGSYPFKITAGAGNPVAPNNQPITSSDSIVTLPIYDDSGGALPSGTPSITIVGFLQVFIDDVLPSGDLSVHVLNVAGCGNDASTTRSAPGTSPVPIRLITAQ